MRRRFVVSAAAVIAGLSLAACQKPAEAPAAAATEAPAAAPAATPAAPATSPTPAADEGIVTRFKANGFSPAWRAEVDGDTVKLDVPEHQRVDPGFATLKAERLAYAKGVEYSGKDGDVEFTLSIDGKGRCDKASDENGKTGREFTATLNYGKSVYRGCADRM